MSPMITQSGPNAYARIWMVRGRAWMRPRASARTGAVPVASDDGGDEPIPVCRECGGLVGIFPDQGLRWQHFRGDGTTSGAQQIYEPGHDPAVTWILPDEDPDDL